MYTLALECGALIWYKWEQPISHECWWVILIWSCDLRFCIAICTLWGLDLQISW